MFVELHDFQVCISKLKLGKAVSFDGIYYEHIIYCCTHLFIHLSPFQCVTTAPSDFCVGGVIPLLKNKHGDHSCIEA